MDKMKLAELVLMGTVTDINERSGTGERGPWRIVTAYLAGPRQVYRLTLPDELVGRIGVGDDIAVTCYATVYNGSVDYRGVALWDGELPVKPTRAE